MAASPSRTLFLSFMLACFTYGVLAADRTLGTVAGNCKDMFATTIQQHYATDKECADLIRTAMSTPGGDQCPGGQADVGTPVHKCMTKNDQAKNAWVTFIKNCEVLNVNERTGAGEAEAAATAKPSCFPRFNSLQAFRDYMDGKGARSAAAATKTSGALLAAGAAAAGVYLLL